MLMNSAELGELGFGFKSIGRGLKKAGKAGYKVGKAGFKVGKVGFNVAALPTKAALKVANAVKGSLCSGASGVATSTTPTGAAFCAAMKAKDSISVRKLLPAAVAEAAEKAQATKAQAQAVYASGQAAYSNPADAIVAQVTPAAPAQDLQGFGRPPRLTPFQICVRSQIDEMGASPSDARYLCKGESDSLDGFRGADAVEACVQDRRSIGYDESMSTTRKKCQRAYGSMSDYDGGAGQLSDAETNLLASLYGADPYDLAYALNGVDPNQIGAVVTKQEIPLLAFSTVAVAAGLWMLFRE
jgi:hypothetical protein